MGVRKNTQFPTLVTPDMAISEVTFAENDRYLLANLIYCEAGGEPYAGQVAVGSVVINRVLTARYSPQC